MIQERLGETVSLSDDCTIVTAGGDESGGDNTGIARVFKFDGTDWQVFRCSI